MLQAAMPDLPVVGVSIIDDASLDALKEAIWKLTGLMRVYLRHNGTVDEEPLALEPGATVADVADEIHHSLGSAFRAARLWGPSSRFDGQQVGRDHPCLRRRYRGNHPVTEDTHCLQGATSCKTI